ncbi:MAG: hypothetical protein OEV64_15635 [Desulfobulbaceae bacterium]|nr:hypothetical protein [Desulfobulbaceae bacterium]
MTSIDDLYFKSVDHKLTAAHQLYVRYKSFFDNDSYITSQLLIIKAKSRLLAEKMLTMDLPALCTQCANREKGGCCSDYMANETDGVLLLINLLMGNSIAKQNRDAESCCFLGSTGCILSPKPMFCLNYNCKAITDMEPRKVAELLLTAGAVLRSQTELENHLLDITGIKPPSSISRPPSH